MDFLPDFTFHCLWKLTYPHEAMRHFGSCTVGRRGSANEAAFATQISKKPRYVTLTGNVKSFVDKRPKQLSAVVALKSSNPSLLVIESCKEGSLFDRFINLLKGAHANGKVEVLSPKRSPTPLRPSYSFMSSPSKQYSRGSCILQLASGSSSEPRPNGSKKISFYNSPAPNEITPSGSDTSTTPIKTLGDHPKTRRLLALPSVRKPLEFEDDSEFETPFLKRPRFEPNKQQSAFRSLNFDSTPSSGDSNSTLNGLKNIGNSCYMNAILQSLLSLDCFAEDLSNPVIQKHTKPKSLYQMLYLLLKSIRSKEPMSSRAILLKELKATISAYANQFAGHFENDAHEFLNQLLSLLCEEWSLLQPKSSSPQSSVRSPIKRMCPVVSNFQLVVQTTIMCKGCGHKRTSDEMYHDLPIYLPKKREEFQSMSPIKLHDVLNAFFEDEVIDCKCGECGHGTSELCKQLSKLPKILIMQLKRYQYDPEKGVFFKLMDPVALPALIDMESYCSSNVTDPPTFTPTSVTPDGKENTSKGDFSPKSKISYRKCGEAMYRLMSVVSHTGGTSYGHYISDVYSLKESTWQSCNDSSITKITEEEVRSKRQKSGYVLFYMHQSVFQSSLARHRAVKMHPS